MDIYKSLDVQQREVGKKSTVKNLIKNNLVPGVIYLKNCKSECISVSVADMNSIVSDPSAMTRIYELKMGSTKVVCILKEVQFNPANDTVRSVDFMEVKKGDVVKVNVPIRVMNKEICPGVKNGGDVYLLSYNVDLKCDVENIPYAIEIDVKDCDMGKKFFLSDIVLPKGCKMIDDVILLRIAGRRVIKEVVAETASADSTATDTTATSTNTASATPAGSESATK